MVFGYENQPMPINVFGGFGINSIDGNATIQLGESVFQALSSNSKHNFIGQTYGDFGYVNFTPIGSPIIDPDGIDHPMLTNAIPFGLED
ncbi:spore germination protein [Aquibacillus kalidii]|uniref:spore germination protein n=1 Tax=Aquibacillus kalidii TaxID=2762597 RepID=UPI001644E667|nr:spore germination protein [Aquibacillus kalidii]